MTSPQRAEARRQMLYLFVTLGTIGGAALGYWLGLTLAPTWEWGSYVGGFAGLFLGGSVARILVA